MLYIKFVIARSQFSFIVVHGKIRLKPAVIRYFSNQESLRRPDKHRCQLGSEVKKDFFILSIFVKQSFYLESVNNLKSVVYFEIELTVLRHFVQIETQLLISKKRTFTLEDTSPVFI